MDKQTSIDFIKENLHNVEFYDNRYLFIVSVYLDSLFRLDVYEFEKEVKLFLPGIRKAIRSLENNFDSVFLLIFEKGTGLFRSTDNKNLSDTLEFLVQILGERSFINEAEKLNHLKVKFSLGYDRYFLFPEKNIFIKSINQVSFNFDIYTKFDLDNEFEVLRILEYYLDMDKFDKKSFNLFLKYLKDFPLKIYRNENLGLFDLQKSLFFYSDFKELDYEKENIKTCQFDSIDVATKILQIKNNFDLK